MSLQTKIGSLLREISKATSFYSFFIHDQPQLLEIISTGQDAVPILLEHLRNYQKANLASFDGYDWDDYSPWYAIIALREITKANPIKPEHAGRLNDIIADWLAWQPDDQDANGNLTYWPT